MNCLHLKKLLIEILWEFFRNAACFVIYAGEEVMYIMLWKFLRDPTVSSSMLNR